MILVFHFICLLAQYIVTNFSKSLSYGKVFSDDEEEENIVKKECQGYSHRNAYTRRPVYENGTLKFFPPVYIQRYETVALILNDPVWASKIKKVVEFGCAELGFFKYLKNTENVKEIVEVDIDEELLQKCYHRAAPLTSDFLMSKTNKPLDVYILAGSISDFDDHLLGCDAVIAIELIEHMSEEAFKKMPNNVFNRIRPKLAIFTTPNADFNSLFPNFKDVRHDDHKFEWSRKEFFQWTQKIIKEYPEYSARFYGIGAGPEGTENLGCCSQMVVFQRSDDEEPFSTARDKFEGIHNYKLIQHYEYPLYVDNRSREEKIIHETQYQLAYLNSLPNYYNYENNESEIPLNLLKEFVEEFSVDEDELLYILKKNGMSLRQKDATWYLVCPDEESNSSGEEYQNENWLCEGISDNFDDDENIILDEVSWDDGVNSENVKNFKSVEKNSEGDSREVAEMANNLTETNEKVLNETKDSHNTKSIVFNKNTNNNVKKPTSNLRSKIPCRINENKHREPNFKT